MQHNHPKIHTGNGQGLKGGGVPQGEGQGSAPHGRDAIPWGDRDRRNQTTGRHPGIRQ